jgi:hypothetical protein
MNKNLLSDQRARVKDVLHHAKLNTPLWNLSLKESAKLDIVNSKYEKTPKQNHKIFT